MDTNQYEEILRQIDKSDYDLKFKGVSVAVLDKIADYGDDYSSVFSYEDVLQIARQLLLNDNIWRDFKKRAEDYIVEFCDDYNYEMGLNWGEYSEPDSVRDALEFKQAQRNNHLESQEEIRTVKTNIGELPIEDYREMVAMQSGYDSYAEMYNDGGRIGKGYDIEPVGTDNHIEANRDFVER